MAKANKLIPVVDGTAGTPIELTDSRIEITNPAANDLLQYDSTQQQFVNTPASSIVPSHRTVNHEQITDSSLGDINLHDGYYFPNAVQDYDGNWYGAVVIGDQVWLGENLRTTHLANGTVITKATTQESENTAYYYDVS
jgi:archaellin